MKLDLSLTKPSELMRALCERLRTERLAQQMSQAEVAARAGIGTNTVSNLETGRNVGFENLIRVAMVPGRRKELEALFLPKVECIADITRYELGAKRQRIRKKSGQD
ncbi:helix-turn-helix transcriptional regulator [Pseudomonas mosselii]|uniref:helix-turn-helix domain-containing protein n=1 Tax=Pseudomonas mosselii TaxID=78327 RepID=UPI0024327F62|nr:helix-turn-helix transcriptional regulator [Pseudomonas mosselii]